MLPATLNDTDVASIFEIRTQPDGFNQGKIYYLLAGSPSCCEEWVESLQEWSKSALVVFRRQNKVRLFQARIKRTYDSTPFQALIIAAIVGNFVITLAQSQVSEGHHACSGDGIAVEEQQAADSEQVRQLRADFDHVDMAFTLFFVFGAERPRAPSPAQGRACAVTDLLSASAPVSFPAPAPVPLCLTPLSAGAPGLPAR